MVKPLTAIIKTLEEFVSNEEQRSAFDEIKKAVRENVVSSQ